MPGSGHYLPVHRRAHEIRLQRLLPAWAVRGCWCMESMSGQGKPTILAVCNGKAVIGLPGNPVSALVIAGLFVVPVIKKLLGEKGGPAKKSCAWPGLPSIFLPRPGEKTGSR